MQENRTIHSKNSKKIPRTKTHSHTKTSSIHSDSTVGSDDIPTDHIRKGAKQPLPIPKGQTPYALAKTAEYQYRDLDMAENYYRLAIKQGERVISATKDLASLMHQRGKTREALGFLDKNKHLFRNDQEKFVNLYKTLEKQLTTSVNSLNKNLKISNLCPSSCKSEIFQLFDNPIRIKSIEFNSEPGKNRENFFCIIYFNSHSSARKTLEGFHQWEKFKVEWVNSEGKVVGDAHYYRQKMEDYRREHPTFDYQVFDRDPCGYIYCLPLDTCSLEMSRQNSEQEMSAHYLLGSQLFNTLCD